LIAINKELGEMNDINQFESIKNILEKIITSQLFTRS